MTLLSRCLSQIGKDILIYFVGKFCLEIPNDRCCFFIGKSCGGCILRGKDEIATSTPVEKLEIAGAIKVGDGGYTGLTYGAASPIPAATAAQLRFLEETFTGGLD